MRIHPFLNAGRTLRNGWWIAIFFLVLAGLLVPLLLVARQAGTDVSIVQQAAIVVAASLICQGLRRRPLAELVGAFDGRWPRQLALGCAAGSLLMLVPALVLRALGFVTWHLQGSGASPLIPAIALLIAAAFTEELLFRGFLLQRLVDGLGRWPAQLIVAGYFLLTHVGTLDAAGEQRALASVNIFLASILFGEAYLWTRSLALPIGLHVAANAMQGIVLGFGVSGHDQPSVLVPMIAGHHDWMTGGAFGLEASVPGLVCVIAALVVVLRWRPSAGGAAGVTSASLDRDQGSVRRLTAENNAGGAPSRSAVHEPDTIGGLASPLNR